jgi:hypothetical protein
MSGQLPDMSLAQLTLAIEHERRRRLIAQYLAQSFRVPVVRIHQEPQAFGLNNPPSFR